MKARVFTDLHYSSHRPRANRASDFGLIFAEEAIQTCPADFDFIASLGDHILKDLQLPPFMDEVFLDRVSRVFRRSAKPVIGITGNHCTDRPGPDAACRILRIPKKSSFFDTPDNVRVIRLQETFWKPNGQRLENWSKYNLHFLSEALRTAPGHSALVLAHTPADDFDWQEMRVAMRGQEIRNGYRANSAALRDIMHNSGKFVVYMAGHTHDEDIHQHHNIVFATLQSVIEIPDGHTEPYKRWADIDLHPNGRLSIQTHGYAGSNWQFKTQYPDQGKNTRCDKTVSDSLGYETLTIESAPSLPALPRPPQDRGENPPTLEASV